MTSRKIREQTSFYQILDSYNKNSYSLKFLLSFSKLHQIVGNERFLWHAKISMVLPQIAFQGIVNNK